MADRAAKSAPNAQLVTIKNFLQDEAIDDLYDKLAQLQKERDLPAKDAVQEAEKSPSEDEANPMVMVKEGIKLGQKSVSKTRHISRKDGVEINTVPFEAAKVCRSSRGLSISVSDIHQSVPWRKRQV